VRRRGRRAILALGLVACGRGAPPVIGFAYDIPDSGAVAVARAALAGSLAPSFALAHGRRSGAAGAVESAAQLIAIPGVVAVVGPAESRSVLLTASMFDEVGIVRIAPTSTSRLLRGHPWTLLLAPDDSLEAEFIARFVAESLSVRTVAIFYGNDEYGAGLLDALKVAMTGRGITLTIQVPAEESCAPSGAAAAAHGVPAAGPPGAVIIATNHAVDAACIARSVLARVPAMHFIAGDGLDLTDRNFRAAAGPAAHAFFTVAF